MPFENMNDFNDLEVAYMDWNKTVLAMAYV